MKKSLTTAGLVFLVLTIMLVSPAARAEAFSFNFNPVTFFQTAAEAITGRVADLIYYLVTQKKYILATSSGPTLFPALNISGSLGALLSTTTVSTVFSNLASATREIISSRAVSSSTAPAAVSPTSTFSIASPIPETNPVSNSAPVSAPVYNSSDSSQILKFTNEARTAAGLSWLSANSVLDTIAGWRAADMFANQYFDHSSPDGQSVIDLTKKVGYEYLLIGENLAKGNFADDRAIVETWLNSPEHKANILNGRYTELGAAVEEGSFAGQNTTITVQIFGAPAAVCPQPNQNTKAQIDSSSAAIKEMQSEAAVLYGNLETMKSDPALNQASYNQKIQEYNYFAKQINDAVAALNKVIDVYKVQVAEYNSCINN